MVRFISLVSASHCLPLQAKEMVELSRSIANKIKDKQGDITEDEVSLKTLRGLIILTHQCFTGKKRAKIKQQQQKNVIG